MSNMQHRLLLTIATATLSVGLLATMAIAHHGQHQATSPDSGQAVRNLQVAQCQNNLCGTRQERSNAPFRGEDKSYGTGVYSGARRSGNAPSVGEDKGNNPKKAQPKPTRAAPSGLTTKAKG